MMMVSFSFWGGHRIPPSDPRAQTGLDDNDGD